MLIFQGGLSRSNAILVFYFAFLALAGVFYGFPDQKGLHPVVCGLWQRFEEHAATFKGSGLTLRYQVTESNG